MPLVPGAESGSNTLPVSATTQGQDNKSQTTVLDQATPGELENALTQFSKQQKDFDWEHRAPTGNQCKVADGVVYLLFHADGSARCEIASIPEGYVIEAAILVPENEKNKYTLEIKDGQRTRASFLVRGASDEAKSVAAKAKELLAASPPKPSVLWKRSTIIRGDAVTVKRKIVGTKIELETEFKVNPLYQANVGLLISIPISGRSKGFAVEQGKIVARDNSESVQYLISFSFYPFAFQKLNGRIRYGRYFDDRDSFMSRISLAPGASITSPKDGLYLGIGLELLSGVSLAAGWFPRRIDVLAAGHSVGEDTTETSPPVEKKWRYNAMLIGFSVDSSLAAKLIKYLSP